MDALIGIDLGKTNLRIGVFTTELQPISRWSTSALHPPSAMAALLYQLRLITQDHRIQGVGISTFGPLDTDPTSPAFGAIYRSSAPAWSNVNLPHAVQSVLHVPVCFDYDVNAGAIAEHFSGAGVGLSSFVYLSIGTGIGAVFCKRGVVPGYAPQMGHMALPREPDDLAFAGACPFHGACFQGLASGSAIAARWGMPAEELGPAHPAWDLEARYIARACTNLIYTFAPARILLASSVALAAGLVEAGNVHLTSMLNGFLDPALAARYAAHPPLQLARTAPDSSLLGAALMAAHQLGLPWPAPPVATTI